MTTTAEEPGRVCVGPVQFHGERGPLLKAIASAQSQIPAIGRDKSNPQLRNRYVTLDAMSAEVVPVLSSCGLCVMQVSAPTLDRKCIIPAGDRRAEREGLAGVVVTTTIVGHESGAFASFETSVPWQEAPGITVAQAVGIGATYAERYAFRGFFRLAATDDTDTDGEPRPRTQPAPAQPAPARTQPKRDVTPPAAATPPVLAEGESMPGDDIPAPVRAAWWQQKFHDRDPVAVTALLNKLWPAGAEQVRRAYWTGRLAEVADEDARMLARRQMADAEPADSPLRTDGTCKKLCDDAKARLAEAAKKDGAV